jgi:hypothetical protein
MGNKDFLGRLGEMKQAYFDAGEDIGTQKVWDAVQLALRDIEPKRWGRKKLARLYERTAYYKHYFQEAFTMSPEADVKQEEQDAMLREIWGDDLVPHKDRYPYCKEFSYKKSRKEWR